jgi:hypothetical protein
MTKKSGIDSRQTQEMLFSPECPDWLWFPPSLLYSGHRRFVSPWYSGRDVKLTIHLYGSAKVKNGGAIALLSHASSWCGA